jgi:hypothetical protein
MQKQKGDFETPLDHIDWPSPGFPGGSDIFSIWTGSSRGSLALPNLESAGNDVI